MVGWVSGVEQIQQTDTAVEITALTQVVAFHLQQVEGMEGFTHRLAIDQDIKRDLGYCFADGFRDGNNESPAVDTDHIIALLADHEAAAIVLFLEAVVDIV